MSSTFFGIGIAQSGITAQRRAMDVLGYNIANANDPTYKRQRVVMAEGAVLAQSQESSSLGSSPFGSGVGAGDVERVRDALIENRMRAGTQSAANWAYRSNMMTQIESIIGEPGDKGLQNDLDAFWNSWQKVATTPDSLPIRSGLLEDASALCQRMQYTVGLFRDMVSDLNLSTVDKVQRANIIGKEISQLNNQIGSLESGAMPINDLQNRRDALVQELAKLLNINQHGDGKDSYLISIGGRAFVQGTEFNSLVTAVDPATGNRCIKWQDDVDAALAKTPPDTIDSVPNAVINNGEIKAVMDLRDIAIPDYLQQLDDVAVGLVEYVNQAHTSGYDYNGIQAGNFFKSNNPPGSVTAANIQLDPAVIDHPENVGASLEPPSGNPPVPAVGNGDVASIISGLKDVSIAQFPPVLSGSGTAYKTFGTPLTLNQMYRQLVGDIGGSSAIATRQAQAHALSLDQFATQQQAISGVSLDEEMTNMIKFQQAYNASARVLTVMDEMLSVLVTAGRG